ncbi:helix-turn-helix protein [Caldicellulosiruptor bescii]|uniref:Transcriptional regulator, XRE family n=3 Tax=Caldicellulosiruptor TaxID=44000 RepID=B9MMU0_CALBD|nr:MULTISPECIES: helix-turn-helix transcriptional regulator [Caldicellulosiruptor]ACM61389.1 transcriptional regulator, XRE family [Caldicellulosiruptor bescii DSM 6725]ADQ45147.1 helix-turn-helix domain protein [Caldicellulosiruptor kronotskyensis 2002]PBC88799.1 helix-turn-helix protein [Caldicellulosiruptor bescii]PBC91719.1 helix-turn-helix protein [Caldicellulosiruptor bescii]PBD02868.1 helix-turn-helix protein [Caldicellulosiruptor bescii]
MLDNKRLISAYKIVEKYTNEEDKKYFELDDILVDIAVKIIQYRIKNNLSQKELAQKLGISQAMVSKLESGDYNPTVKMLYEIAKKLGFELEIEFREKTEYEENWVESSEELLDEVINNEVGEAA